MVARSIGGEGKMKCLSCHKGISDSLMLARHIIRYKDTHAKQLEWATKFIENMRSSFKSSQEAHKQLAQAMDNAMNGIEKEGV